MTRCHVPLAIISEMFVISGFRRSQDGTGGNIDPQSCVMSQMLCPGVYTLWAPSMGQKYVIKMPCSSSVSYTEP